MANSRLPSVKGRNSVWFLIFAVVLLTFFQVVQFVPQGLNVNTYAGFPPRNLLPRPMFDIRQEAFDAQISFPDR